MRESCGFCLGLDVFERFGRVLLEQKNSKSRQENTVGIVQEGYLLLSKSLD